MATFDLNEYKQASDWGRIPSDGLNGTLEETVDATAFPGCLLPAWVNGEICWYAFAIDQREWRALQPILMAYVGHTVTTFDGEPSNLNRGEKVEAYIMSLEPYAVARLKAPHNQTFAIRALQRMKETVLARPMDLRPLPMSTAQMLSHFDMCLVEGDRKGAFHWLERLRTELRLDAINLSFTRVKLHATFREWNSILLDKAFGELCRIKKPTVIAHHLLEAIWYAHLDEHSDDFEALKLAYEENCRANIADILAISGVPSEWVAETYQELIGKFQKSVSPVEASVPTSPPTDEGKSSKADFTTSEKVHGANADRMPVDGLSHLQREEDAEEVIVPNVTDWLSWAKALTNRQFRFRDVADQLALRGDAESVQDPEDVRELEEALYDLDSQRALPRLIQTLSFLIKWLKFDEGYPRKLMAPLYEVVLLRLIESRSREGEFREGVSEMFTALLEVGLSESEYRSLLIETAKAIPPGAGTTDTFWLLDLADVLCRFSAADEEARNTILNRILGILQPVLHQMSSMQRSAYSNVATSAGWEGISVGGDVDGQSSAEILNGKLVGIYTLTESAGRQAEATLKRLAPDVKVEISSEKVCTPRLMKLSQNADIMVVTASSAKHAATDCIRDNREAERILYAAGRGCCSILRAIEEFLADAPSEIHG